MDMTNLPVGTRVVYARHDPTNGDMCIPGRFLGKSGVTITGPHYSPHWCSYTVRFDSGGNTWGLSHRMLDLEEGPW